MKTTQVMMDSKMGKSPDFSQCTIPPLSHFTLLGSERVVIRNGSAAGTAVQRMSHGWTKYMHLLDLFCRLHLARLTWNLRIHPWKRRNIFQTIIFRFYVNLGGCMFGLESWHNYIYIIHESELTSPEISQPLSSCFVAHVFTVFQLDLNYWLWIKPCCAHKVATNLRRRLLTPKSAQKESHPSKLMRHELISSLDFWIQEWIRWFDAVTSVLIPNNLS